MPLLLPIPTKRISLSLLLVILGAMTGWQALSAAVPAGKLRVVILSDISNEPDDQQSLVRFLTYANEFDVEGLIATTSCWRRNNPDKATILKVLDAYEEALPNLRQHAMGCPDADALRRVTKAGVDGYGMISKRLCSPHGLVRDR